MAENIDCQICKVSKSKYSCPRCNVLYCSVLCYQSEDHLQCSEIFYERWVQEELKNCQSDPEARKRMFEILKQNQHMNPEEDLDSDDNEEIPDLASRMMDINLDDEEAVWEKLTLDERQEFRKLVATGNIIKILPEWEPWWKTKKRKTLISSCDEDFDWKDICPVVLSDIPNLSKLTKANPSPHIAFMLLNVLMSYVFTVRWFKGIHKDLPVEGISTCIALSSTLRCNKIFKDPVEAFIGFEKDLSECDWVKEEYDRSIIHEDLVDIINGSVESDSFFCLKAAISDMKALCAEALIILKKGKTNHLKRFSGTPPRVSLVQQISRKMNYYLSWIASHGNSMLNIL